MAGSRWELEKLLEDLKRDCDRWFEHLQELSERESTGIWLFSTIFFKADQPGMLRAGLEALRVTYLARARATGIMANGDGERFESEIQGVLEGKLYTRKAQELDGNEQELIRRTPSRRITPGSL